MVEYFNLKFSMFTSMLWPIVYLVRCSTFLSFELGHKTRGPMVL